MGAKCRHLHIQFETWRQRRGSEYHLWREYLASVIHMSEGEVQSLQTKALAEFLEYAVTQSKWYAKFEGSCSLGDFPVLTKQDLVGHLDMIATLKEFEAEVSYTGGTTGASLKVLYRNADTQQRFAMLDWFRSLYGWELGKKTAWFSGKTLARDKDIRRGICYRDDWINRIRYFSTFHINERNFEHYWNGLVSFEPEFIVGFPASVIEICRIAQNRGMVLPKPVKAYFPVAETVLPEHREVARQVMGCNVYDQYASSEGAPFILECPHRRLHIHPLSGVFEVVDDRLDPARTGEVLVTSFTTHGTPLIRYQIGDRLVLAPEDSACGCGWPFPIVEQIEGRNSDFLWSPELGRINLGNLSNSTKGVEGLICFQAVQNEPDEVTVLVVGDRSYDKQQEKKLEEALRLRTGSSVSISIVQMPEIPREASGKFRIVKNNLKPEMMVLNK